MSNAEGELVEEADVEAEVTFLRLVVTRTRHTNDDLQLAQFIAYGAEGEELQLVDARNPNGRNPSGEGPANALDGSAHTKWLDSNKGMLECRIASGPTRVTKYTLVTANDAPGRDPVRWVVEGRLGEGGEWRVLDDKDMGEDQQVPSARHAMLDVFHTHRPCRSRLMSQTSGQLHAFLLANPLTVPAFFKSILTDATHAAWLGEAVEAAPSLAELTDADGRRAIDRAHEACRVRMQTPAQLQAFLLTNPQTVPAFFKFIVTDATHADWLGEAVKATPELARLTDPDGRRAVDVAHATCRQMMLGIAWLCKRYELQPGPPEHQSATSVVIRAEDHADKPDYAKIFEGADEDGSGTLEMKELDVVAKELGLSKDLVMSEASKQGSATSKDGTTTIQLDKDQFVNVCRRLLGDGPRKVVIKLMKDKVQWQREMTSRSWEWDQGLDKYIPSRNELSLDAQYVVQALDAPTHAEITTAVSDNPLLQQLAEKYMEKASIKEYAYPVVMDAANRNLAQIYLQERPGPEGLRDLARQIFNAVEHLHFRKLMHGDLKTLNLVRSIMDGKLRLIDFDAFATIFGADKDEEGYACAKFSSGVLPPEALYQLKGEERSQFDTYWEVIKDKDPDLWSKVQPKVGKHGKQYVVKTFRTGSDDGTPITDVLPYKLLPASASLDMWSLGVMLYLLLTGEHLVPVTRDDDFVSGTGMGFIFDWDDQKRREKLSKINDPAANDLLSQLLSTDPIKRSNPRQLLDEHPFFNVPKPGDTKVQEKLDAIQADIHKVREEQDKQTALLLVIKDLSTENKTELRHTREALMKGIFEATEVHTPTTFIVLNEKLPEPPSEEEKTQLVQIAENGSGVTVSGEFVSATFTAEGLSIEAAGKCKEYVDHLNTGMKWANRLKTVGSKLAAGDVGKAFETIKQGLGDLVTGETMYLYLVDELTGLPVRADGYPIEITKPSEIVPKLLPVMQVGLRAMSILNGAAGIARMVGYPVPTLSKAWIEGVRESVDLLNKKSSVEDFDVVQDVVDKEGAKKESDSVRGQSLRVFTDFLSENDPGLKAKKSGHFAGLQRIGDPNSGTALWTTLTKPKDIKEALEKRTSERKAEELGDDKRDDKAAEPRDGNGYIQDQAAGSLVRQTAVDEAENKGVPEGAPGWISEAALRLQDGDSAAAWEAKAEEAMAKAEEEEVRFWAKESKNKAAAAPIPLTTNGSPEGIRRGSNDLLKQMQQQLEEIKYATSGAVTASTIPFGVALEVSKLMKQEKKNRCVLM